MARRLMPYCLAFLCLAAVAPWLGAEPLEYRRIAAYFQGEANPDGTIFFQQRVPRVLLALLAGGGLALVGAAFQVLFRNPLVEPYTIGITGGASVGAFLTVAFPALCVGLGPFNSTQLFALLGTAAALLLIFSFARRRQGMNIHVLLLAGVTVGMICSGLILLITYLIDPYLLTSFHRWMMGSVAVVGFRELSALPAPLLPGVGLLLLHARGLNHLSLGPEVALGHGVDVRRLERDVFIGGGLITAGVVSMVGPIGFVGLIVPHVVRRLSGFDQRLVLPASFLLGGAALCACDAVARTVIAPAELPVGVITALVGGPLFVYLLVKGKG
jgi:iron complex transport system permease protein